MKTLHDILEGIPHTVKQGATNIEISCLHYDSRKVSNGDVFFAIKGTQTDGHKFIDTAINLGAKAIVFEAAPDKFIDGITYIHVNDPSYALALAANNYHEHPDSNLKLIGVTGTNGKTTIVTLLYNLFQKLGYKAGLLSTIRILINDKEIPATHTTPDPLRINELLAEMVDEGCEYCFMEVSSHAVVQNRIAGLKYAGGVFTNITHDHLDYHNTFDAYIAAKKAFFDVLPKASFALVNADDKHAGVMIQNTHAECFTYSVKNPSDFKAKILESDFSGLSLNVNGTDFYTPKVGDFNAYNLIAVYGTAIRLGINPEDALMILSEPIPVDGRFEIIQGDKKVFGVVDYAHTPDALENVLRTINNVNQGKHNIITVFGCGGNRDKAKRPKMGQIAADLSNTVIITSDNPRKEDPFEILHDIERGLNTEQKRKSLTIEDREQAIKTACTIAHEGDIILVAGKGHEKYQDINGVKSPFDDKKVLVHYLNQLK